MSGIFKIIQLENSRVRT
uniref:Uncharacterized protein n=1 Tax=Arundo donax TaxID=35708 RepID=A0A0A8YQG8_ARUDO